MIWSIALCFMFANVISSSSEVECGFEKTRQSPVNINTDSAIYLDFPPLDFFGYSYFKDAIMEIKNNGHTVEVEVKRSIKMPYISGGPLKSNYEFAQLHLHWGKLEKGSEHYIDGFEFATEIHVVHYNTNYDTYENAQNYTDGLCVVAIFGKISEDDNQDLNVFIEDLNALSQPTNHIYKWFKSDFSWLLNIVDKNDHFITYDGSLTTSPYKECVKWILLTKVLNISKNQLNKLRTLHSDLYNGEHITHNDRPLQPLCGRKIYYR